MLGGVDAGHRHAVDPLRAEGVAGDGGHEGGVDAAAQAEQHRTEAVLLDVVVQGEDERAVHLGEGVESGGDGAGGRMRVCRVDVDDEQRRLELGGAGEHGAVGGDDEGVAVEDQLVLPADEVDVGQHRAGLAGPLLAQREADVVLVALVGGGVEHGEDGTARLAGPGDGAAVLPQVLADRDRHVDAVDGDDERGVAGHEVAGLVEDPVVGQVVLDVAGDDLAVADDRGGVDGRAARPAGGERAVLVEVVEVADEAGDVAVAVRLDRAARSSTASREACWKEGRSARSSTG